MFAMYRFPTFPFARMLAFFLLHIMTFLASSSLGFMPSSIVSMSSHSYWSISSWQSIRIRRPVLSMSSTSTTEESDNKNSISLDENIDFSSLMETDVVIYRIRPSAGDDSNGQQQPLLLGALEEGTFSPLSIWTLEPVFGNSIEFLVDDEDRFSLGEDLQDVQLLKILDQSEVSYGSRQAARGVHNPHGEESEPLYYVEQDILEKYGISLIIKPQLEILW